MTTQVVGTQLGELHLSYTPPTKTDIIAYEAVAVDPTTDIQPIAREVFNRAMGSASHARVGGKAAYGNDAGLNLLEEKYEWRAMTERLERHITRMETKITSMETKITGLKTEVAEEKDQNMSLRAKVTGLETDFAEEKDQNMSLRAVVAEEKDQNMSLRAVVAEEKDQNMSLRAKVTGLETDFAEEKGQNKSLRAEITELRHQVKVLTLDSEGYRMIRNRFLNLYKRNVLKMSVKWDGINDGNQAAHEGDAIADAALYTTGARQDEDVLQSLYGFNATQLSNLGNDGQHKIITALNAGASWRAKGDVPADVDAAFKTFAQRIRESDDMDITDHTSSLGRAYWAFWSADGANKQRLAKEKKTGKQN